MTTKWHKFNSQYSPLLEAGKPDSGDNNVVEDWNRLNNHAVINDVAVIKWKAGVVFNQENEIKQFLENTVLLDLAGKINKDEVATYLLTCFHQGGFMCPVSGPMANLFFDKTKLQACKSCRELRIITTARGFKVEEVYTVNKLATPPGAEVAEDIKSLAQSEEGIIGPDKGNAFVIKAGASIDVDFSQSTQNPTITVESNYISYGCKLIQAKLDERHIGQIIIDFFRNLFRLNSLIDISSYEEQQGNDEPEEDSCCSVRCC